MNIREALERIAKYPVKRGDEMSIETARDIARAALSAVPADHIGDSNEMVQPAFMVGNLVTVNQDEYPALGDLFVQLWDGDAVVARVYGNDHQELNRNISKLNVSSQDQQPAQEPVKGCKECDGQTYMHSPTGEYLGECPHCSPEWLLESAQNLATHLWQKHYKAESPVFEVLNDLAGVLSQIDNMTTGLVCEKEPVMPWICPDFMLPPRSEEVLVYPMPTNVAHTAFHDGECWRVTEYENNYGYSLVALPDGFIKGWMHLPLPPVKEVTE